MQNNNNPFNFQNKPSDLSIKRIILCLWSIYQHRHQNLLVSEHLVSDVPHVNKFDSMTL